MSKVQEPEFQEREFQEALQLSKVLEESRQQALFDEDIHLHAIAYQKDQEAKAKAKDAEVAQALQKHQHSGDLLELIRKNDLLEHQNDFLERQNDFLKDMAAHFERKSDTLADREHEQRLENERLKLQIDAHILRILDLEAQVSSLSTTTTSSDTLPTAFTFSKRNRHLTGGKLEPPSPPVPEYVPGSWKDATITFSTTPKKEALQTNQGNQGNQDKWARAATSSSLAGIDLSKMYSPVPSAPAFEVLSPQTDEKADA